ncbi:ATP-binding protein [Desulfococcaceae bacterium HSG8]|nr:ATP-binding protein [Desulfococcaceae bacterium HSG8]
MIIRKKSSLFVLMVIGVWTVILLLELCTEEANYWKTVLQVGSLMGVNLYLIAVWQIQDQRQEKYFQGLIERGTDIIQVFTEDGTIIYHSPSHSTLGYAPGELVDKSAFDLFHEADMAKWQEVYQHLLQGEDIRGVVHRIRHKDGHYRYFESDCVNHLRNNSVNAVIMNARDISELRLMKETLRKNEECLQTAAEVSGSAFFEADLRTGDIIPFSLKPDDYSFNESACKLSELLKHVHPDDLQKVTDTLDSHMHGETPLFYCKFRRLTETYMWKWCLSIGKIIQRENDGTPSRMMGMGQDILGAEHSGDKLQKAKEAAEAAARLKCEFMADMSHELRTPLNGILGYTQILRRDKSLTERQANAINIIHRSGEHLLSLINDITDISKIETGRMELELTDFHMIRSLKDIAEIARIRAQRKRITFDYTPSHDLPAAVHGDEVRLRQVLLNLLDNAVRFTEKGGLVFSVRTDSSGAGFPSAGIGDNGQRFLKIRFEVKDTGIGIPNEDIKDIFSPFHQARETGLGLAISQRLVRMMGGELNVESIPNQGTSFWFELRFPEVRWEDGTESADEKNIISFKGEKKKLLVADDVAINRSFLKDTLGPLGFEVTEAVNGSDALNKALKIRPDLILMDLVMPVMDGFEATRHIRKMPELKNVVVIAVSASMSDQSQDETLAAGFDYYISKPVDIVNLIDRIQMCLELEWIYEEKDEHRATDEEIPIVTPPREEVEILFRLAMKGDITRITEHARKLETSDPAFKPFGDRICELAERFMINKIEEFLTQYL